MRRCAIQNEIANGTTALAPRIDLILPDPTLGEEARGYVATLSEYIEGRAAESDNPLDLEPSAALLAGIHSGISTMRWETDLPSPTLREMHRLFEDRFPLILETASPATVSRINEKRLAFTRLQMQGLVFGMDQSWNSLIHGDFYPSNVIRDQSGKLLAIDFDLMRRFPTEYEVVRAAIMFSIDAHASINWSKFSRFCAKYLAAGGTLACSLPEAVRFFCAVQSLDLYGYQPGDELDPELQDYASFRVKLLKSLMVNPFDAGCHIL
ncbi:hypothetical protein XF30_21065 [Bradyrhizobium sp. SUTN9-2]|nr:hypothetical protein XF30_21065 [Bradyrhizobium sp. SUTN9-2]